MEFAGCGQNLNTKLYCDVREACARGQLSDQIIIRAVKKWTMNKKDKHKNGFQTVNIIFFHRATATISA